MQTRDPSNRAATDLRFRPNGYHYRKIINVFTVYLTTLTAAHITQSRIDEQSIGTDSEGSGRGII